MHLAHEGDRPFIRCVCVCMCVSSCAQRCRIVPKEISHRCEVLDTLGMYKRVKEDQERSKQAIEAAVQSPRENKQKAFFEYTPSKEVMSPLCSRTV